MVITNSPPPLFCVKKPSNNLQGTCFTEWKQNRSGTGISFSAAGPAIHPDRDRYPKCYRFWVGITRLV